MHLPGTSAVLSRDLRERSAVVGRASGIFYHTESGERILDGCGGSGVACLGYGDERMKASIAAQMEHVPYCHSHFFTTPISERLSKAIVETTGGKMANLLTLSSGSEAVEAALKLARQYFLELPDPQPQRKLFIARQPSYHGATLSTLAVGGHVTRRAPFEPMLLPGMGKVSLCRAWRGMGETESASVYIARLAAELEAEFERLGPENVCAFIGETVTGASTGCVAAVEGYWQMIQGVCQKHGALLILDEVMCGMGRTGTMHAWEQEGIVPNIQVIGKGMGAGYIPVSGVLLDHEVRDTLASGSGKFSHGQSFQAHPVACAAALSVQRIIREDELLSNVCAMGNILEDLLRRYVGSHRLVGDIRGRGLFWAIEFVEDKTSARPFPAQRNVGYAFCAAALRAPYYLSVYPGKGTIDGIVGDHILLAPAYVITHEEVKLLVGTLAAAVVSFFDKAMGPSDVPSDDEMQASAVAW